MNLEELVKEFKSHQAAYSEKIGELEKSIKTFEASIKKIDGLEAGLDKLSKRVDDIPENTGGSSDESGAPTVGLEEIKESLSSIATDVSKLKLKVDIRNVANQKAKNLPAIPKKPFKSGKKEYVFTVGNFGGRFKTFGGKFTKLTAREAYLNQALLDELVSINYSLIKEFED